MDRQKPLFVYGNWSAYDELSDGIELTEHLAMTQLSHLLRLRDQGVRFDAYLMDAFWYAPDGAYREWRKPHWPDGPERWLVACQECDLLPGLWFTVNTLCHLEPAPKWRDSVDAKAWGMCLSAGGFLEDYREVLEHWYSRGVRLFKFDFAEFDAFPAGQPEMPPGMARQWNIDSFRSMLADFRHRRPDAVLMAFNGFDKPGTMERTDQVVDHCIDPKWLRVFDSMYCGDPRPSDVPDVDYWRSVDLYSDHMVRVFASSGIPLDRIDNCAFMAGPTGTCYWRGKAGWQRMLILSLARGGRIHVAYGDLSQFSDEDARWWAEAQRLYVPAMERGKTIDWGGTPGEAEPYGWESVRKDGAVLTLVNPGPLPERIPLGSTAWRIATCEPEFTPELEDDEIRLGAGQLAVLVSGEVGVGFSLRAADARPISYGVVEARSAETFDNGGLFCFGPIQADHACLIVQHLDAAGRLVREYPGETDWAFQAEFRIGDEVVETQSFPARKVWSGMSWACFELPAAVLGREFTASVRSPAKVPVRLEAHVRLTTMPADVWPRSSC